MPFAEDNQGYAGGTTALFRGAVPGPFQISPHYLDPDPSSTHMGETQEERIMQFLEENDQPVVGLREGSILRIQDATITLKGPNAARVFRRGEDPCEVEPDSDLSTILGELAKVVGARA
jgi:dipeptidase E